MMRFGCISLGAVKDSQIADREDALAFLASFHCPAWVLTLHTVLRQHTKSLTELRQIQFVLCFPPSQPRSRYLQSGSERAESSETSGDSFVASQLPLRPGNVKKEQDRSHRQLHPQPPSLSIQQCRPLLSSASLAALPPCSAPPGPSTSSP